MYGAIEGGGTWFRCAVARGPRFEVTIEHEARFATRDPASTLADVIAFFRAHPATAIALGMFGPIDLRQGALLATPKAGWSGAPIAAPLREALGVRIETMTDVTASALGEVYEGAARDCDPALYLTVGTGIGGGLFANGFPVLGLLHPEIGHMRVPRRVDDSFAGVCPFHGDCLEGLASGPAIQARAGVAGDALPDDHDALALAAHYVGVALANVVLTVMPDRIVLGGGVGQRDSFRERVHAAMLESLHGYVPRSELTRRVPAYIVPPKLGERSAIIGALCSLLER